jgi:hypothetical protein
MWKEKKNQGNQKMAEMTPRYNSLQNRAWFWFANGRTATGTLWRSGRKSDAAVAATAELVWVDVGVHFTTSKF